MTEVHYPMSCPFCERFPVMVPVGSKCAYRCQGCDARGPPKLLPSEAAKAWDEIHYRRRMTDRDLRPGDDDAPKPTPSPATPRLPEMA